MDDDLGVADAAEHVAGAAQCRVQFLEVVYLAVVDVRDAAILVVHRLLAAGEVDDRKAAVTQPDAAVDEKAATVRPAVREAVGHRLEQVPVDRPPVFAAENTYKAAHALSFGGCDARPGPALRMICPALMAQRRSRRLKVGCRTEAGSPRRQGCAQGTPSAARLFAVHPPLLWKRWQSRRPIGRYLSLRPRSVEHTSELPSQMRISFAAICMKK